jgi:hypothetical protein
MSCRVVQDDDDEEYRTDHSVRITRACRARAGRRTLRPSFAGQEVLELKRDAGELDAEGQPGLRLGGPARCGAGSVRTCLLPGLGCAYGGEQASSPRSRRRAGQSRWGAV